MKKLLFLILIFPLLSFAQQKVVKHTVAAQESYSSIGRIYNVNGRVIANFNKLDYETGLAIGQILNIPVPENAPPVILPKVETPKIVTPKIVTPKVETPKTETPKVEPTIKAKATTTFGKTAKKHTVGKKETLYGLSKIYSVTIADIKKWNNLTVDGLNEGSELIVGYGDEDLKTVEISSIEIEEPKVVKKPVVKTEPKIVKEEPKVIKPIVKKPEPKKEEQPVFLENMTTQDGFDVKDFKGGIFKSMYKENGNNKEGIAGVFKSTSGWEDGKYYCLHNTAKQGNIIKVTNKANGKSIYAKVLDVMPDLKQNNSILLRISNAAADALGETVATNLSVTIDY